MHHRTTLVAAVLALVAMAAVAISAAAADPNQRNGPADPSAGASAYSAAELYNRANGFARAGKAGLAVLDYERARLLAPADADIDANLRAVRESQHLVTAPASRFERVLLAPGPTAAALLGLAGLLLITASATPPPALRRRRAWRSAVAVVGTLLCGFTLAYGQMQWQTLRAAIIIAGPAAARASPASMADALFTLVEGDSVRITATHADYVLVQVHSGATGWVVRSAVAPVVPATEGRHDLLN